MFIDPMVSTHSRLKAAGEVDVHMKMKYLSFNTQPPEGGWQKSLISIMKNKSFNTQPPEGGWYTQM